MPISARRLWSEPAAVNSVRHLVRGAGNEFRAISSIATTIAGRGVGVSRNGWRDWRASEGGGRPPIRRPRNACKLSPPLGWDVKPRLPGATAGGCCGGSMVRRQPAHRRRNTGRRTEKTYRDIVNGSFCYRRPVRFRVVLRFLNQTLRYTYIPAVSVRKINNCITVLTKVNPYRPVLKNAKIRAYLVYRIHTK